MSDGEREFLFIVAFRLYLKNQFVDIIANDGPGDHMIVHFPFSAQGLLFLSGV